MEIIMQLVLLTALGIGGATVIGFYVMLLIDTLL